MPNFSIAFGLRLLHFSLVSQTVKDIAQSLIDDGEINMDKIGTSNYYWSFPSQDLVVVSIPIMA